MDDVTRAQLQCIAEAGEGTYFDAQNADQLAAALEGAAEAASNDTFELLDGLGRPNIVRVSPDGRHIYVSGDEAFTVTIFARYEASGLPTFMGTFDALSDVSGLTGMRGLTVSPDGRFVYATGFDDNALAMLARGPQSGRLTFVELIRGQ